MVWLSLGLCNEEVVELLTDNLQSPSSSGKPAEVNTEKQVSVPRPRRDKRGTGRGK